MKWQHSSQRRLQPAYLSIQHHRQWVAMGLICCHRSRWCHHHLSIVARSRAMLNCCHCSWWPTRHPLARSHPCHLPPHRAHHHNHNSSSINSGNVARAVGVPASVLAAHPAHRKPRRRPAMAAASQRNASRRRRLSGRLCSPIWASACSCWPTLCSVSVPHICSALHGAPILKKLYHSV